MSMFEQLHARIGELGATQMFFIGGAMKSGTTWLQLLLNAHPEIVCKGEGHVTDQLAPQLLLGLDRHNQQVGDKNSTIFGEMGGFPKYNRDDLAYLVAASLLLAFTKSDTGKQLRAVGEKTPDNVRNFGVLQAIFPAAKFLHVVRDGRDCAVSCWFHNLRTNREWAQSTHPDLPAYATMYAREWAEDLQAAQRFAEASPDACLTVRYESLLDNAPAVLRGVFKFLGVSADAEIVGRCCEGAAFERLSDGRARGDEDRDSFFRSGTHGNWREHLDEATNQAFIAASGPWLRRLGYLPAPVAAPL